MRAGSGSPIGTGSDSGSVVRFGKDAGTDPTVTKGLLVPLYGNAQTFLCKSAAVLHLADIYLNFWSDGHVVGL